MNAAKPGQYLSFSLADHSYAIPIASVREINRVTPTTPVPETAAYVAGVMNLRGKVIPVFDLRLRFGMQATPATKQSCIIVVDSERGQAGLLVDAIHGVTQLRIDQIEGRPNLSGGGESQFVSGMGKLEARVLILLDVERILDPATDSMAKAA